MLDGLGNRLVFPAPQPSYQPESYRRHLCWLPWSEVISPKRVNGSVEDRGPGGVPCLWFPAPKAATVILFFHANAEDLGMAFAALKHMRDQFKVNVLAVEYPGYGLLHRLQSSEEGVFEVALTALRYLVDNAKVSYSQVILFGRSLGTGPAVHLAAQYPVGGLILVSAFASLRGAVQSIAGRFLAMTFTERFANQKIIGNVSCSTLFIHGECDTLVPPEHSMRLFERCRARKLLIMPKKVEHNFNLFGDPSFVAVPAINFFGFPGYSTSDPPRLPPHLFENPEQSYSQAPSGLSRGLGDSDTTPSPPWLCGFMQKSEPHCLDVSLCCKKHGEYVEDGTSGSAPDPLGPRPEPPDSADTTAPGSSQGSSSEDPAAPPAAAMHSGYATVSERGYPEGSPGPAASEGEEPPTNEADPAPEAWKPRTAPRADPPGGDSGNFIDI